MSDSSDSAESDDAARMELGPDAIHEGDQIGPYIDCPSCGASLPLAHVIEEGECTTRLDAEAAEVETEDEDLNTTGCGAQLRVELVWEA